MPESPLLVIGGRVLRVVPPSDFTRSQTSAVFAELRTAGLSTVRIPNGTLEAAAALVLHDVAAAGRSPQVLAGFLLADGAPWSTEAARRHTRLLERATPAPERQLLFAMVEGLVQGFFGKRPGSPENSPTSSTGLSVGVPADMLAAPAVSTESSTMVPGTV